MSMLWMILTPRESSIVATYPPIPGAHGALLAVLKARLNHSTDELELSREELQQVRTAARHWQAGGQRAFDAILTAADRHGF